ncbi:MAG: hypothetical protein ABIP93_05595 [Gemmatimonadaceae bacterium]
MHRLFSALATALFLVPCALAAQPETQAWLLTPGARVRVTYPGENARIGSLIALTADTVTVQWSNSADTARMARERVTRFDVSRGMRPSDRGSRAKVGLIVGMGSVLLIAKASGAADHGGDLGDLAEGLAVGMGALMAGGVGALIGAATGGPSERWEEVPLAQPRVAVVLPALGHGTDIDVDLEF